MRENTSFPKALVEYITKTPTKSLEGDGYILLIEIFQTSTFKDVTSIEFIGALFNSLEYIKEEKMFLSIVFIIVTISSEYTDANTNPVLKLCYEHPHRRYLSECVVQLVNKGKSAFLDKTLKFCAEIFRFVKTKNEFFYSNDLDGLVDIIHREFVNTSELNLKIDYLRVLFDLIQTDEYKKTKKMASEFKEAFEELKITEGVDVKLLDEVKKIENLKIL